MPPGKILFFSGPPCMRLRPRGEMMKGGPLKNKNRSLGDGIYRQGTPNGVTETAAVLMKAGRGGQIRTAPTFNHTRVNQVLEVRGLWVVAPAPYKDFHKSGGTLSAPWHLCAQSKVEM